MENTNLITIVNNFFENNPPPYFSLDIGNEIPIRKLKNASKSYASFDKNNETPLFLIDGTSFRSAKTGVLCTNKKLYYKLYVMYGSYKKTKGEISLTDINDIYFSPIRTGANLFINGENKAYTTFLANYGASNKEAIIINNLFKTIIDYLVCQRNGVIDNIK